MNPSATGRHCKEPSPHTPKRSTAAPLRLALWGACAFLSCLFWPSPGVAANGVVTPAMVGQWDGNARIIVVWCQQTNLAISLNIKSDGSVTGRVGDAVLSKGRLLPNRGWLGRKLNLATDQIITGTLNGPIVAADGVTRESVKIPLNFNGTNFIGGLHTSGSLFGGSKRMVLSAAGLVLRRSDPTEPVPNSTD